VEARFSAPVQTSPGAHPVSCKMGTRSFPGVKRGRRVTLNPHSLLVLRSRKSRATPLHPLWAVWPVQSLSACTRVHFTYYHNIFLHSTQCSTVSPLTWKACYIGYNVMGYIPLTMWSNFDIGYTTSHNHPKTTVKILSSYLYFLRSYDCHLPTHPTTHTHTHTHTHKQILLYNIGPNPVV